MSNLFPANRIAAIAAFLTGIIAALTGITSALPTAAANVVISAVGVLGSIVTCLHFMSGAQKSEALQAHAVVVAPHVVTPPAPAHAPVPPAAVVVKPLPKMTPKMTTPTVRKK
jgi:hypothetical protein